MQASRQYNKGYSSTVIPGRNEDVSKQPRKPHNKPRNNLGLRGRQEDLANELPTRRGQRF